MTPAILNRPLPDTNTGRSYSFAPVSGYPFSWVLEIVQVEQKRPDRSETEVYGVEEVSEPGSDQREFAVAKCSAEPGDDQEGLYFVSLPCPARYAARSASSVLYLSLSRVRTLAGVQALRCLIRPTPKG